ncbi:MAG: flippase-like domain-containing protein [candidate division Zixibacteria bacterium]|nr:flippase-like domain-containing protein [candidate division Zixibacteria bacterium]
MSGTRRNLYVAVGLAISVILLWVLFRNIDFGDLGAALTHANYWWLIPNIALAAFAMHQRAYRWKYMINPIKEVRFGTLLSATCIGFMANNVLPLRLGEFARAYSLSFQDKGISKSASLATIFVERMVFDLVILLAIFGLVVSGSHLPGQESMTSGAVIAIGVASAGIIFVIVLAVRPEKSGRLIARVLPFVSAGIRTTIENTVVRFSHGLAFIKRPKDLAMVSILTVGLWILMWLSNWFVFHAFGFDGPPFNVPLAASFVLLVVVSISILIPSSPGFVGVYHAGTVWTLTAYGIDKEHALSFALVLHAAQYIPITLMGFYYLRKSHLSLKALEQQAGE